MDLTLQDWRKGRADRPWLVKFHLAVEDVDWGPLVSGLDGLAQGHTLHGLTDYRPSEVSLQGDFNVLQEMLFNGTLDASMYQCNL